jgi:peptide/nickel transport system substrate-binding protein
MGRTVWLRDLAAWERFTRRQLLIRTGTVAAAGVAAGLLAACGGDDDDDDAEPATTATTAQQPGATVTSAAPAGATAPPAGAATQAPTTAPSGEVKTGGTLNYGTLGDLGFGSLDMTTTTGTYDLEAGRSMNDSYLWLLPDGSFAPGLAESWEVAEDGLAYTFTLREDVVFHDGTPLNAEAAKFNFDRMTNRETNPSGLSFSYLGAGGAGYKDCEVVDESTFRINLERPNAIFLFRMRRKYVSPQSPTAVQEHGADYFRNPVGCGPFKFVEWSEGDHLTLEAFEEYHGAPPQIFQNDGRPYLDQVVFRIYADLSTKAIALEAGEVDYAARLNEEDMIRFQDSDDIEVLIRNQRGQATDLAMNTEKFPTDDFNVRQAIGWAIDREALVESVFFGLLEPATHFFTTDMWSYDGSLEGVFGYDPDKAVQLLEDGGWTGDDVRSKDGQPLHLIWILSQETLSVGQFVQAELAKVGMEVELQVLAGAGLTEAVLKGQHNISGGIGGWVQEDPDVVRNWVHSSLIDVRQNPVRVRDPELDALVDSGIAFAGDPHSTEREEIYKQIQREILENAYIIPLYYRRGFEAYHPYVKFNQLSLSDWDPYGSYHEWTDVWLDK